LSNGNEAWAPEYISVGFVAKCCGVSNTTVLRWISAGELEAFRLPGGHYRIEKGHLSDFLARYHMPLIESPARPGGGNGKRPQKSKENPPAKNRANQ
jgi:excisionase family DNA binding protein